MDTNLIYRLQPVSFDWKDGTVYENKHDFGLIAEEVDTIFPDLVAHDEEGQASSVDYAKVSVLLLAEVKKIRQELNELKENL